MNGGEITCCGIVIKGYLFHLLDTLFRYEYMVLSQVINSRMNNTVNILINFVFLKNETLAN